MFCAIWYIWRRPPEQGGAGRVCDPVGCGVTPSSATAAAHPCAVAGDDGDGSSDDDDDGSDGALSILFPSPFIYEL